MELLINKDIASKHLQIAIGSNEIEFAKYVAEAQELDLRPLFNEIFFNEILKNKDTLEWEGLFKGGSYEYEGNTYSHTGIEKVLSYFTYARYILKSNITDSSFGFTIKKTPNSEPLPLQERRNFYNSYKKDANSFFVEVQKYIQRNPEIFGEFCDSAAECEDRIKSKSIKSNFRIIQ